MQKNVIISTLINFMRLLYVVKDTKITIIIISHKQLLLLSLQSLIQTFFAHNVEYNVIINNIF